MSVEQLTPREQEIFDMLLDGASLKEIAYKVDVSYKTAERDRTSLYRKLGVQSFQELVAKYGSLKNGSVVQNKNNSKNVFLNKYRIIFIISVIVLILAASFFFSWFFTRKASVDTQLPDLSIINSLASEERPFIVTPFNNEPHTWHFQYTLPMFINNIITEGDVYVFSYTFTSNVDFDILFISLQDHTIGENGYTVLFTHYNALSVIKANTEYSGQATLIPHKTASSTEPRANMFNIDILPLTINQPVLTFTKFDFEKIN